MKNSIGVPLGHEEKTGEEYVACRRTMHKIPGHPKVRLTEASANPQVTALFNRMGKSSDPRLVRQGTSLLSDASLGAASTEKFLTR